MGTCLWHGGQCPTTPMILWLCFANFCSFLTSENVCCFLMSYTTNLAFLNVCSRRIFMLSCLSCCWSSVFDPRFVYLVHKDSMSHHFKHSLTIFSTFLPSFPSWQSSSAYILPLDLAFYFFWLTPRLLCHPAGKTRMKQIAARLYS